MNMDHNSKKGVNIVKVATVAGVVGAAVGAAATVLSDPDKRRKIQDTAQEWKEKGQNFSEEAQTKAEDMADDVQKKAEAVKKEVKKAAAKV